MTSTTNAPALSTFTRSPLQRPVFSRQEKSSVPSSGCSNIGLSSGTDSTVSEEDENEDTIVKWGWVWYKGEMRRISELPPAPAEPPKPSPPKRKFDFKPVFYIPSPPPREKNDTAQVASVEECYDQRAPDGISQTLHRLRDLELHSPAPSPIHIRKPSFITKPLVEASYDDIFDYDDDLDCDLEFEADFADDELEDEDEDDEDYDTLDPNSLARYISDFLDPVTYSDDEEFE